MRRARSLSSKRLHLRQPRRRWTRNQAQFSHLTEVEGSVSLVRNARVADPLLCQPLSEANAVTADVQSPAFALSSRIQCSVHVAARRGWACVARTSGSAESAHS